MSRSNCRELCLYCTESIYYYVNHCKFHGLCFEHGSQSHLGQKLFCSHCRTLVYVLAYSFKCQSCKSSELKQLPCECYQCLSCKKQFNFCEKCGNIDLANMPLGRLGINNEITHDKSTKPVKAKKKEVKETESDDSENDRDWLDDLMDFLYENFGCGCNTTESTLKRKNG